jgi:hypothetical protein
MFSQLESFGRGGLSNRYLHLLELARPEDLEEIAFGFDRHFAVILAWNATDVSSELIAVVAEALLDRGAVSLSCWGDDCRRVHDILTESIVGPTPPVSRYSSSTMTTWHERESFEEALWYALFVAQPTDRFEASCRDSLVLLIDQPEHTASARAALGDPDHFSNEILRSGQTD